MFPESSSEGDPRPIAHRLIRQIRASGPISVAQFMAEANAHYYGGRDPLGARGDFITAPEISQMFGELIGLWLADMAIRAGGKGDPAYVELGPGRGTLAADALRAMARVNMAPRVHLVETSPALRERQRLLMPQAQWHDDIDGLPTDRPLLVAANEFFDALPIRQIVRKSEGWRERMVDQGHGERAFDFGAGRFPLDPLVPPALANAPEGSLIETSPASATAMLALSGRIARQGGAAIIIDYGYEGPAIGDTLQAVRGHRMTDPFDDVGDSDLTAHVDFTLLGNAARQAGLVVQGPVDQGAFLQAIGLDARAQALARSAPERAEEVEVARRRLSAPDQMGTLFKVMAVHHPDWPTGEGFA